MKSELEIKIEEWETELVPIIQGIAQCESKIAFFKTIPPENVIGERPTAYKVNGQQGKVSIKAGEAMKNEEAFLAQAETHKAILLGLIKAAKDQMSL